MLRFEFMSFLDKVLFVTFVVILFCCILTLIFGGINEYVVGGIATGALVGAITTNISPYDTTRGKGEHE